MCWFLHYVYFIMYIPVYSLFESSFDELDVLYFIMDISVDRLFESSFDELDVLYFIMDIPFYRLFESSFDELDVLVRLELKKTVLDRMVHLLSRGCVIPVVGYIKACWEKQDTDISLIRHFVTEVSKWIEHFYFFIFRMFFSLCFFLKAMSTWIEHFLFQNVFFSIISNTIMNILIYLIRSTFLIYHVRYITYSIKKRL